MSTIDQVIAAIEIHEAMHSPLLLQGAEMSLGYMGGCKDFSKSTLEDKARGAKRLGDAVKKYGENSPIPIALHLDHGKSLEVVKAVIDGGFTSVMYDGSDLPFEENLKNTKEIVDYAHGHNVTVEAELGVLAGVEDHVFSAESTYTNPLQALEFIKETGVDLLAISYGTMHGTNKGKNVKLRTEIVTTLRELLLTEGIECGIVSHGSSTIPQYIVEDLLNYQVDVSTAGGISIPQITKAIQAGINKINVDSDIRMATMRNFYQLFKLHPELKEKDKFKEMYQLMVNNPKNVDPRLVLRPFMDEVISGIHQTDEDYLRLKKAIYDGVYEITGQLIVHFASLGKAQYFE